MNREAVALGTPVWTTFSGKMGGVDEVLIAEGETADAGGTRKALEAESSGPVRSAWSIPATPSFLADAVLGRRRRLPVT